MTIFPEMFDLPTFNGYVRVDGTTPGTRVVFQQGLDHFETYIKASTHTGFRDLLAALREAVLGYTSHTAHNGLLTYEVSPLESRETITVLPRVAIRYRLDAVATPKA